MDINISRAWDLYHPLAWQDQKDSVFECYKECVDNPRLTFEQFEAEFYTEWLADEYARWSKQVYVAPLLTVA
ncbi:MAG: hypothetical protein FI699_09245 [SAR202 cluster bacterium]|nr:hypothetical protein [SAR202 cluster bacterium]